MGTERFASSSEMLPWSIRTPQPVDAAEIRTRYAIKRARYGACASGSEKRRRDFIVNTISWAAATSASNYRNADPHETCRHWKCPDRCIGIRPCNFRNTRLRRLVPAGGATSCRSAPSWTRRAKDGTRLRYCWLSLKVATIRPMVQRETGMPSMPSPPFGPGS